MKEIIHKVTQRYIEETESYSIRFNLLDCNVYWETYWDEDKIQHVVSIYKSHIHLLSVSGSREFIKSKILKWVDEYYKIK